MQKLIFQIIFYNFFNIAHEDWGWFEKHVTYYYYRMFHNKISND